MKTTAKIIFGVGVVFLTLSFDVPIKEVKKINSTKSNINWGAKKIRGQHTGTLKFKEGTLEFVDEQLVGGFFVVDMNSLTVTDLKGFFKKKLEKNLKSEDFFETEVHKFARMKITSISGEKAIYEVTADFTIKGLTKSIVFNMSIQDSTATATLALDRTNFGVRYKSSGIFQNIKNKAIENLFDLEVFLKF
jgi:polyisoprenoid-binding protein YceI